MVVSLTYSHKSAVAAATYSCVASGPGVAAAESGLTKKEAQDFKEFYERRGASVKCTKGSAASASEGSAASASEGSAASASEGSAASASAAV
jgi:hypothetical protein